MSGIVLCMIRHVILVIEFTEPNDDHIMDDPFEEPDLYPIDVRGWHLERIHGVGRRFIRMFHTPGIPSIDIIYGRGI